MRSKKKKQIGELVTPDSVRMKQIEKRQNEG